MCKREGLSNAERLGSEVHVRSRGDILALEIADLDPELLIRRMRVHRRRQWTHVARNLCARNRPILLAGFPHTTGPSSGAAVSSASSTCPFCRGTGLCHRCGGKGSIRTLRSKTRPCRECGGSGKCALCGGTGLGDWRKPEKGGGK